MHKPAATMPGTPTSCARQPPCLARPHHTLCSRRARPTRIIRCAAPPHVANPHHAPGSRRRAQRTYIQVDTLTFLSFFSEGVRISDSTIWKRPGPKHCHMFVYSARYVKMVKKSPLRCSKTKERRLLCIFQRFPASIVHKRTTPRLSRSRLTYKWEMIASNSPAISSVSAAARASRCVPIETGSPLSVPSPATMLTQVNGYGVETVHVPETTTRSTA